MLSTAILISGSVYLWAAGKGVQMLRYLLKPGTMLLICALAASGVRSGLTGWYAVWVLAALVASLAGDVFLMLPQNRFLAGLAAFLVAHLFYIYALWRTLPVRLVSFDIVTGVCMILYAVLMLRRLGAGLRQSGQRRMLAPVTVYVAVIAIMVWRSLGLLFQTGPLPVRAWLVAAGGVLFCISDSVLGWDRFVRPLPGRDFLVMGTYFAAQYCFALSTGG